MVETADRPLGRLARGGAHVVESSASAPAIPRILEVWWCVPQRALRDAPHSAAHAPVEASSRERTDLTRTDAQIFTYVCSAAQLNLSCSGAR